MLLQATLPLEPFSVVPSELQILISARSLHNVSETEPLLELWQEQPLLYLDLQWASPVSDVLLEESTPRMNWLVLAALVTWNHWICLTPLLLLLQTLTKT